jgi:CHAT domain-containing protein/tetratricopeptide (TPR) repeat protein
MNLFSLRRLALSNRKARLSFLLPFAFCLLPISFCLSPSPRPVVAQAIQARKTEADQLYQQGRQQQQSHQYQAAIQSYKQALAIYRAIRDRLGESAALGYLGLTYEDLGDYAQSIHYAQQALAISREIKNHLNEGTALAHLGSTYRKLGNYAKAIEYGQQSLVIAREIKNRRAEGIALGNLSIAHRYTGNYVEAFNYAQQELAISLEIKDREGVGAALNKLGIFYAHLHNKAQALGYLQQSLEIAREIKDQRVESRILGDLGSAYDTLGDHTKAIEYTQQWLAIAREIKDSQGEASALYNLGKVYSYLGNNPRALEYYKQSLAISRKIKDSYLEGAALNNLGVIFLEAGKLSEAEKILISGIQVWESMRRTFNANDANKVSIFEQQARTYRTLQQVYVAQHNPIAALEIAERGRARTLIDLLTQRLSSDSTSPEISAPNQAQIRQVAKSQNATLVQYSIIYDKFQVQGKQASRESVLYIWVVQLTGEITFRQVDLKPLWQQHNAQVSDLVIGNQEFLAVRSRNTNNVIRSQPNLPTLHQLLIHPIANLLPKDPNAKVIFIPQGDLFQVPFPALQDAKGTYLIQKHTILTAPSIQVLALTRQQRQKLAQQRGSGNALVLGNPTMPSVSSAPGAPKRPLSSLPGAETEAKAIAPLLNTQPLLGAQATKAAVTRKMPEASIIHLATHGRLDDQRGLGSAIALAPSGNDNGWLTADEIFNMRLQASLVVLSACDTAGGKITGDGIIGLSRSLISAGVPSVIVTLWAVPDAPTAELMQAFYRNLQTNPDKAQALRQAMLATMKTHPQPRDWAAFTLIGEAK